MDKTIKIWCLNTGKCIANMHNGNSALAGVDCMDQLPDGNLITGSQDKEIKIWQTNDGRYVRNLTGHTGIITCLKVLYDNDRVASGSSDKSIRIWNHTSGKCLRTINDAHSGSIVAFEVVHEHTNELLSCSTDKTIRKWNLLSGNCVQLFEEHANAISSIRISFAGHLYSCSLDNSVKKWDLATGKCLETIGVKSAIEFPQLVSMF